MKSAPRTPLVLASIFLVTLLLTPLLEPLEVKFYDNAMAGHHDSSYVGRGLHPALSLLVYSEGTEDAVGAWTPERSRQMIDKLLRAGATQVIIHPGAQPELVPPARPEVTALALSGSSEGGEAYPLVLDSDGICRWVALGVQRDGKWQPTVPLRTFAKIVGANSETIAFLPGGGIKVGERLVPTDPDYRLRVRFRRSKEQRDDNVDYLAPLALERIWSGLDTLATPERVTGKTFLLGSGFKQAMRDVQTPLETLQDYKVDACVLETMLVGWSVWEPRGWQRAAYALVLLLVLQTIYSRLPIAGVAVFWIAGQLVFLELFQRLFGLGIYLPFLPFLLISSGLALWSATSKFHQAREALARFGGAGAFEAATRGDERVFDEVREKTATIVFTNVLSYLKELERHGSPNQFFERRQQYAQLLSDVFRKHGGVVLDYQGDFQMVGFNVELRVDDPDHALHAVQASHEFLERVPEVTRTWWEADEDEIGTAHCGICTGPVACGHVGSQRHDGGRIAQAAIGDTSNVSARLLGAAMKQREPIIMAMTTVESAGDRLQFELLEAIPLKGKTQAVPIARPIGGAKA